MPLLIINQIIQRSKQGFIFYEKRLNILLKYLRERIFPRKALLPPPIKRIPLDPRETDKHWVRRIKLQPIAASYEDENNKKELKYAIVVSYCGKNYFGSQRTAHNDTSSTIEGNLQNALLKEKLITRTEHFVPQMMNFQRVSRTDKGVSAVQQVFSVKLSFFDFEEGEVLNRINKNLPKDIRVFKITPTTRTFDAKFWCDSRTYSYMSPTFAFAPLDQVTNENYRISPNVLEELRKILQLYRGSHNFHNFSSDVKPYEMKSRRNIRDISCSDPFERGNLEWLRITIEGDSFMRHQIRKMVALAMASCKGIVPRETLEGVFEPTNICNLPIAPGLGLVLEGPSYRNYNRKLSSQCQHKALDFADIKSDLESFKEDFIDSVIVQGEKEEKTMLSWLPNLFYQTYECLSFTEESSNSQIFRAKLALLAEREREEKDEEETKPPEELAL